MPLLFTLVASSFVATPAWAAASLQLTPATWNVIGLDSNNPSTGPNRFPVGARVCNSGDATATGLTATFKWDTVDTNIALRPGTSATVSVASVAPGACADLYYEVEVLRAASSYGHSARYYIELTSAVPGTTLTTPRPRALYVERLVSQARNAVLDVQVGESVGTLSSVPNGGTMTLLVGNSYYIRVVGSTATQGYEQLESFITLPNTTFQLLSVETTYSADSSPYVVSPNSAAYGDACLWDNDPNSPSYRSCRGSGKVGGSTVATYHVKILSAGSSNPEKMSSLVHDFSGSSFHYNGDYDVASRYAYIVSPADVGFTASFTPATIAPAATSTLAYRITNPGASTITGVSFTSVLPTSPGAMVIAATPSASTTGCGTPAFAPSAGANSITFSGGTLAPGATCTVKVNVTATSVGTYTSTTTNLFINDTTDTGKTASAQLSVTASGACTSGTMARWSVPVGTTANPPDLTGGVPTLRAGNVSTATLVANVPGNAQIITSGGQGDTTAWATYGYKNAGQYIQFVIDAHSYSDVQMRFWIANPSSANGPTNVVASYNSGSGFNTILTIANPAATFTQYIIDLTGKTSTTGNTTIRIAATGALNDSSGASLNYDNITFTGCSSVPPPTLSKSFGASSINRDVQSTALTFSVGNNGSGATAITGVAFTDTMPSGLVVASPSGASTTCASGTVTATPGTNVVSLSGASLAAAGTCSVSLNVKGTAAGLYDNVTGYITSNETPANNGATGYGAASITVVAPPSLAFDFTQTPIFTGTSTTASFTVTNPNVATTLNGLALSATLPEGLTVADSVSSPCGGTLITAAPSTITFSGATLAALDSCTVDITVTGTTAGAKDTTFGPVSATNGGTGNSVTATVFVDDALTAIALLKQIAPTASGPWSSFQPAVAGSAIYYRFTVENIGDVPLSAVSVTDPTITMTCPAWPDLPVASASNDDHIATCVLGPFSAAVGNHVNTATAQGTNGGTTITSTSSATYASAALSLAITADESSFAIAGDVLHFNYLVTNSGFAALIGPTTISDAITSVSCPSLTTVGDNDDILDVSESVTCTSSYTVTAADIGTEFVTSAATATVDGVDSNLASATVNADTSCVQPTNPTNGTYGSCDGTLSGSTCTLTCASGYTASGDATCTSGTWSTETCNPNACTQPTNPANGTYATCTGTASGDTCELVCNSGYTASNDATCTAGTWSVETCNPNACTQPTNPANGTYATCTGTASGDTCALVCNSGYTASDDATCTAGTWSVETCNPNACTQPTNPANGTYATCTGTASGDTCALVCNSGYTASDDATCTAGTWSVETCAPNSCTQPTNPANGTYDSCGSKASGTSCTLTCASGYAPSGDATCTAGTWSVETCVAGGCSQPANPAHGTYTSCGGAASGSACILICDSGYTANGDATCTAGTWSTQTCDATPCTQPSNPDNGTYAECDGTASGGSCALTCNSGYTASRDATCTLGTWSVETCRASCTSDLDCTSATPVCDLRRSVCVECLVNDQCASGVCNTDANTCTRGCVSDSDCGGAIPRCNPADNLCVTCLATADCVSGVCDPATNVCVACLSTADCANNTVCDTGSQTCVPDSCSTADTCNGATPFCDPVKGHCVGCLVDDDCGPATVCDTSSGACIECRDDSECGAPNPFCDLGTKRCVACLADNDCTDGVCHPTADTCVECAANADCNGGRCALPTLTCEPLQVCGDATVNAGEGCDDGNNVGGDGCSAACLVELGYPCGTVTPGLVGTASCATGQCYPAAGPSGVCGDRDSDGDGVPDIVDIDDDNDGLLDTTEGDGLIDSDGDDIPDTLDLDSDDDGLTDAIEAGHHLGDGDVDAHVDCASGVGTNGFCDDLETAPDSGLPDYDGDGAPDGTPVDTDGDGVFDFRDLDSDNDGWGDAVEAGDHIGDGNGDGVIDCPSGVGLNGLCDDLETEPDSGSTDFDGDGAKDGQPLDTDGDGLPDYRDLDSDDDGLSDADELSYGTDPRNPDSDGGGMSDGEEVRDGRDPTAAADDDLSVKGGRLFGCQATPDIAPLGIAVGLWLMLRRLTRKQADGETTHV